MAKSRGFQTDNPGFGFDNAITYLYPHDSIMLSKKLG